RHRHRRRARVPDLDGYLYRARPALRPKHQPLRAGHLGSVLRVQSRMAAWGRLLHRHVRDRARRRMGPQLLHPSPQEDALMSGPLNRAPGQAGALSWLGAAYVAFVIYMLLPLSTVVLMSFKDHRFMGF